ncbi:E3 ubiquitin-protein ligase RNF19A-like isoform X1 [Adelges cooleyi]|uniref:E3 ubiquitin-protein ligase RNF19A-like isoform X1 n=2 Tax=Adelges cooleyi TaxID=133065 RepID=UPI00217FB610|nr:E3 ubiquitin-protein ligase RNF19A-like isoform X1 [Adelges cooleyi]XP_050429664.1 E3 ubiquitin-protein ligase RNF19A-like isoform X1 [Adelges cooleyi]
MNADSSNDKGYGMRSKSLQDLPEASSSATPPTRKRRMPRFSLRRLLYSNTFLARHLGSSQNGRRRTIITGGPSVADVTDFEKAPLGFSQNYVDPKKAVQNPSVVVKNGTTPVDGLLECPLCLAKFDETDFAKLSTCAHRSCFDCFQQYLRIEICESRVNITCPECSEAMHPNDIQSVLNNPVLYDKYEDFMVRRVLAVDPDTRYCPSPDCSYAVIAAGCASCPKIKCERPGCDSYFCYHCKAPWHPNQTCDSARAKRSTNIRTASISYSLDLSSREDIKPCPRCQVLIVKMDDGSCNHMTCAVCGAEFCWLCMKVVSDLHYLSPSGCTFWGKKPWSRKKKLLWQLGTLIGAPAGIGLIAGIAIPAIIIGVPVWTGRKMFTRYRNSSRLKRNFAIAGGVLSALVAAPVLATLAVGIGVPILLFYVYGVVPVSLCRSGGCGVTTSASGVHFDFDEEHSSPKTVNADYFTAPDGDTVSHGAEIGNPSIGEPSFWNDWDGETVLGRDADRESASTVALAGSLLAHKVDNSETASMRSGQKTSAEGIEETQSQQPHNLSLSSLEELTAGLMRRVLGNAEETDTPATIVRARSTATEVRFGNTVSIITPSVTDGRQHFLPLRGFVRNLLCRTSTEMAASS